MSVFRSTANSMYRCLATHFRWLCRVKMLLGHVIGRDRRFWGLHTAAIKKKVTIQPLEGFFNLHQFVLQVRTLLGDIAELGVYRGGCAKFIAQLKGDKLLHLFDTFQSTPETLKDIDTHQA